MSRQCQGLNCTALIIHAVNTTTRKTGPIDAEPSADGNIRLRKITGGDSYEYDTLSGESLRVAQEVKEPLHLNHFVTCPDRQAFGKKRK